MQLSVKQFIDIDIDDIMSEVFHNIWRNNQPWVKKFTYGGENEFVPVTYDNPDYDMRIPGSIEYLTKVVSKFTLVNAYIALLKDKKYHCGELVPDNLDEWDTCVSGYVLQYALFGELIFN
jgi:hypothetical protein